MRRINLIPKDVGQIDLLPKGRGVKIFVGLLLAFALFYLWQATAILRYRYLVGAQEKKLQKLQSELTEKKQVYQQFIDQREQIDEERKQIARRIGLLQESRRKRLIWSNVLVRISQIVPQEIWLRKVALNEKEMVLTGTSPDNALVSKFMEQLDGSDYFYNTGFHYIQKSSLSGSSLVDFEITTRLQIEKIKERP